MERAEQEMAFKSGGSQLTSIKASDSSGPAVSFTNSGFNKEFAPIQKTAQ